MKKLIINADDFGLSEGVSAGISRSILQGVVSTTSIMPCDSQSLSGSSQWVVQLHDRIGVHLQLTGGMPCSELTFIPSLVSTDGRFPETPASMRQPQAHEILIEWHCQMQRVLETGLQPTHIDTHHFVHTLPAAFDAYCKIAHYYGLPARTTDSIMTQNLRRAGVRCADLCEVRWFKRHLSVRGLTKLVDSGFKTLGGNGTLELMCHPGYADSVLREKSSYVDKREDELEILCDPAVARHFERKGIVLINRATDREAEWC